MKQSFIKYSECLILMKQSFIKYSESKQSIIHSSNVFESDIINSNFDSQKMSLIKNSSRKKFTIAPEDLAACLDQKNSMIAVLQTEVEDLRFNHEKYQRMQEEVYKVKEKYESCLRNYQLSKVANNQRLQLTVKNCLELKIQLEHLTKEAQIRQQQLKDVKAESQQLVQHNSRRQDEVAESQVKSEELKTANQLFKMEEERTKIQVTLARQELERQRRENTNVAKSVQTVKEKCYKTQSYIRNLLREESALNQNLTKIEDQNNYLDRHITELNSVHSLVSADCALAEKECQDQKFLIASKELELKRLNKQIKQTAKHWASEKEKFKVLTEEVEQKKFSLTRMQGQVRECSDEINYIMAKNNQVTEVNTQLKNDMKVCQRHLENVVRLNKTIEAELSKFKELNVIAIKKLQEPMRDMSNNNFTKKTPRKWSESSRMTATGGFESNYVN